jgi:dimethylhistidine N-methyltransferase
VLGLDDLAPARTAQQELASEILIGLSERPKRISSRFFYDDEGSRLFQEIMRTDEYYPTRCETEILTRECGAIVDAIAREPLDLIDLGAGDGAKTMLLIEELVRRNIRFRYVPIDISEGAMRTVIESLRARFPTIDVSGIVASYQDGIDWHAAHRGEGSTCVLFLGSNIGNFDLPHARAYLRRLWSGLRPKDHVLIGFDMKKDIDVLLAAYNDSAGITARFNLNLLVRLNRELGAHFDIDKFRHFGTYDVFTGSMKSYLVSLEDQEVWIEELRHTFRFDAWEPVHTEYSYKYLDRDIEGLAQATGFSIGACYQDARAYFSDALFVVENSNVVR